MPIQRSHSRRRRVFLDESIQVEMAESVSNDRSKSKQSKPKISKLYSDAAKREGQLKTTDLIPKSNLMLGLVIGGCVSMLALLFLLAIASPHWSNVLSENAVHTLSFSGQGTISSWFSSFLLLLSSMASLQIYSMRRHRNDDYRGTYKIWLWLAGLFVVASVNSVVDFRSIVHSLASTAGYPLGRNLLLLVGIKFVALNVIVVRGLLEIRQSRGATVAVMLSWIAYTSALAAQIPLGGSGLAEKREFFAAGSLLVGNLAGFSASLIFARFIYLHVNGLLRLVPQAKSDQEPPQTTAKLASIKKSSSKGASPQALTARSKPEKPAPEASSTDAAAKPSTLKKSTEPKSSSTTDDGLEEEILSLSTNQGLSKSERRRLKKLQKRQRRAA